MFNLIASTYGEQASLFFMAPRITISGFDPSIQCTHKVSKNLGGLADTININHDLLSVEIITQEDLGRKKVKGAALGLLGAALVGPLGIAAYFMGGKNDYSVVNVSTNKGATLLAQVSKDVLAKLKQGVAASELYTPAVVKDFFEDLDPSIAKAIKVAEGKSLCKKENLDLSKCRMSAIGPNKVLLVNKSGRKIGLIQI